MEKEKELKEFVKWFNDRNDFPVYPSFQDVDMFLSLNSDALDESRSVSENEKSKEVGVECTDVPDDQCNAHFDKNGSCEGCIAY
jgi:hypothetical protein